MGKREDYIKELLPLLSDEASAKKLESKLISNSNLPGPRANLELAFALADCFERIGVHNLQWDLLQKWAKISLKDAPVNSPMEFLPFCALLSLGSIYDSVEIKRKEKIILTLKKSAKDSRRRTREAVAFGFQRIAEKDFRRIEKTFSEWIKGASLLDMRAIIAALAHPPILNNKDNVLFSLQITNKILHKLIISDKIVRNREEFRILKKGLEYAISVFVANLPNEGFSFLKKWAQEDDVNVHSILKSNLKKSRLTKKYKPQVDEVLSLL